ncbi:MAG: hypothetical protein JRE18_09645 [Deltaproteobacteria bacterium]|nr:hypothetical protein [Deltaproteobacteria bacterium]
MLVVVAVFEINQKSAFLEVDEVELINELIFADGRLIFQALFFCGSAGYCVDVSFFSYADLGIGV